MPRNSRFGKVFADDPEFIARFVDIWRRPRHITPDTPLRRDARKDGPFEGDAEPCTPISLNDIAWELGVGASKVAITMKYAEQAGWVRRTSPRTEQAAWEPTEKALEQFPDGKPQVMPDPVSVELPGGRVTAAPADDLRFPREERQPRVVRPGKPFRGYLPEGSDDAA